MKILLVLGMFLLLGICLGACAATPDNNLGWLMDTTGSYVPQDTDVEQNGYQEFQGQLDYMQGHEEQKHVEESNALQIQDKMSDEYREQIKQQSMKKSTESAE